MAIYKCKMCGGDLEIKEGATVCECEFCGTKQTVPTAKTEVLANLFNRANKLRIKCEFDKAEEIYEKILGKDETLAEAHWGLVLCKYGIEYVEDPVTETRVPTCHRTSYESVTSDTDYLSAVEYADSEQKKIYKEEAKVIEGLQKRTLEIVKNEKPFDVFICYKETDKKGKRTVDSTYANDIYHQLTNEGFKVFYAAITLEDKLGQEYEPYIFAALNSAKVMLVIGTNEEYFNAIWVKNEWSRFLKLMKTDRSKLLIPCYKDIDPYDLPEEFAHLQAQDMGKIGFVQDLLRGIKKVVKPEEKTTTTTIIQNSNDSLEPLLKRAELFLNDGDWQSVYDYCEKVLDLAPECYEAYLYKFFADIKVHNIKELENAQEPILNDSNYKKVLTYCSDEFRAELTEIVKNVSYKCAERLISAQRYREAIKVFDGISGYKDSSEKVSLCNKQIEKIENNYNNKIIVKSERTKEIVEEFEKKLKSYNKLWLVILLIFPIGILSFVFDETIALFLMPLTWIFCGIFLPLFIFGLQQKQINKMLKFLNELNIENTLTEVELANIENVVGQDIVGFSLRNFNRAKLNVTLDILSKYSGFDKKVIKNMGNGFRNLIPSKKLYNKEEIESIIKEFESAGATVEIKKI